MKVLQDNQECSKGKDQQRRVQVRRFIRTSRQSVSGTRPTIFEGPRLDSSTRATKVTGGTRTVFSKAVYPERATICICSRHRQRGHSALTILFEQLETNFPAQHERALTAPAVQHAGPISALSPEIPFRSARVACMDLQQQGMEEAGTTVTPTNETQSMITTKRLGIVSCF